MVLLVLIGSSVVFVLCSLQHTLLDPSQSVCPSDCGWQVRFHSTPDLLLETHDILWCEKQVIIIYVMHNDAELQSLEFSCVFFHYAILIKFQ